MNKKTNIGVYMTMVLLTALGVGGATIIGAIIGFAFSTEPSKRRR